MLGDVNTRKVRFNQEYEPDGGHYASMAIKKSQLKMQRRSSAQPQQLRGRKTVEGLSRSFTMSSDEKGAKNTDSKESEPELSRGSQMAASSAFSKKNKRPKQLS